MLLPAYVLTNNSLILSMFPLKTLAIDYSTELLLHDPSDFLAIFDYWSIERVVTVDALLTSSAALEPERYAKARTTVRRQILPQN